MGDVFGRLRYTSCLTLLIAVALLLLSRLMYLYLSDPLRFPINTVKIVASYEHVTRQQLAKVLSTYTRESFIFFPVEELHAKLMGLSWIKKATIKRMWPGTLTLIIEEKQPVAFWNSLLMTADGEVFEEGSSPIVEALPHLLGPEFQKNDILVHYQRLNKVLSLYGLHATALQLHANQAWELSLTNGVKLQLGKQALEKRVLRFCRAYPAVFAEKQAAAVSVDLRYPRGMAVLWTAQK